MTREETISALTADILERDGDTYVLKGTKNRLGWDEGLTGRYSARIVECKDPLEAIRHGVTLARNMVTAMNLPTAFTLHVDRDSNCTDGANIWLSTKVFDEKDMDPNDRLDVFIGLAVHEGSHILYSKFGGKASRDHRLVKHLDNLYEDERIERLTGEANPGLANFLAATKNYMFGTLSRRRSDKDTKAILVEESANGAIGTDLLKIVNTILAMVRYPKVLDEDSLVRFADILMKVRGIIIPYPDSPETVREAALKTYDLLREYVTDRVTEEMREEIERDLEDEEDPEEEPGEDEEPEEENDERGDEDRDEPDEPDEHDEDEKMEIPGDSCVEGGEPASGEGSDGNSGENPGEGSGEGAGEGAGENSDGGLREGSGDDADGNDGGSREERIRERVEEILGERQDEIEDRIEAILGELLEEMDGAMQVIAVPMSCAPDGMLPENTDIEVSSAIRNRIQAKYCESGAMKGVQPRTWFTGPEESVSRSDYNASAQRLRALVTPVEKALKKHFRDVKLVSRGMRSGHLDTSKLAEASLGVETVYTQHGTVRTDSIAVAILIDQSGSMYGSSIAAASDCAVLLQEAMERIPQIQLFIYGHTADTRDGADTKIMIYREGGTRKNMEIARCRAMSNNRDGYAIREVAQRVRQKTALPVLMFVLSDGMPAALGYDDDKGVEDTRKAVQEVTKMGFSPVQIAIDHYVDPKRMFDNWLVLTKLETLAHDLSRVVSAALVKNTKIRRA